MGNTSQYGKLGFLVGGDWVSRLENRIAQGRKPNWKSETEPESPTTEPVAVYKETGETGNRRNRNRGLQKVVQDWPEGVTRSWNA